MGNLLSFKQSFEWEDSTIDRGEWILILNECVDEARTNGDRIYKTPDLFEIRLSWGDFFQFIWSVPYQEIKATRFAWMSPMHYQTLTNLYHLFKNQTPAAAATVDIMRDELPGNGGYVGFYHDQCPNELVCSVSKWERWHSHYVSINPQLLNENREYYLKFYKPQLKISAGQINELIDNSKVHPIIKRIDLPHTDAVGQILHGEQIHVHFSDDDESALNIDGSWKHKKLDIHNEAKDILRVWGFLLPEDLL